MTNTVEQIYTGCLAHGAYYIESNGEAAIVDPLREVQPYIDMAEKRGAKIKYVFETHFHADFVSGHVDLAAKTGAAIVYGPTTMETGFDVLIAQDNQEFKLGDVTIRLIHTPGHTPESSCFLLIDENGKETSLFTGDTLFIGDVGRPDLAQKVVAELTQEKLASMMFDSLRNKIMPLDDDIIVYPGHGAGSACGKNMSKETTDTLGNQKRVNYALDPSLDRDSFIKALLSGLTPPPEYFPQNVLLNISGYQSIDDIVTAGTTPLSLGDFIGQMDTGNVVILDTRSTSDFCEGFVPGSINISLDGKFASWVGAVLRDVKQPLLLVTDIGAEEETAIRLARVGFDNLLGHLDGGFETWAGDDRQVDKISSITVQELATFGASHILDVRKASEFESEHIVNAVNAPLDYWWDQEAKIGTETQYVICGSGYRSVVFISLMLRQGHKNFVNVLTGMKGVKNDNAMPLTEYVCPSTML